MREALLPWLRCPNDRGSLDLAVAGMDPDGHVTDGTLRCTICRHAYPITAGVPNLLPAKPSVARHIHDATVDRFGYQWVRFADWGWRTPRSPDAEFASDTDATRKTFLEKSLFDDDDLRDSHLILDAGCGNGRFAREAARQGATVIAIDLGDGVLSAFANTRTLSRCHVVRGDLLRPPFATGTFDRIFSIGVLHHTGATEEAFASLRSLLTPDGRITAHVYGKGLPLYELSDRAIRAVTTRLPVRAQRRFARFTAAMARWLRGGPKWRRRASSIVLRYLNLVPTEVHMFDWWSAPVATHHELEEVARWFESRELEVLKTRPARWDADWERNRRRGHGAVTVYGGRRVDPDRSGEALDTPVA